MNQPTKIYGFIPPVITKDHYILGASPMPFVVQQADGDWSVDLPVKEYQEKNGLETYNCTGFNTLNQIEAYFFKVFGITVNFSDRWLGIIAGTQPPGNDPQVVYEAIRANGLIPEDMLPFSDDITSLDEYYSFKGADEAACRAAGKAWLEKYEFFHEWAFGDGMPTDEKINNIKVALQSSPLAIAVYAWAQDDRGAYVKLGDENHWTCMYKFDDFERIFDSYDPFLKMVDQDINFCKRIYIRDKSVAVPSIPEGSVQPASPGFFQKLWMQIKKLLAIIHL